MPIESDTQSVNAHGGTEIMKNALLNSIDSSLLDHFQIFVSRVEQPFDETKIRLYYAHDLECDPAAEHALGNGRWQNFHMCIFVSNWQMQRFIDRFNIPWSYCAVLLNAIKPIEDHEKPEGTLRLAYWSTPHRGLSILVPVFDALSKQFDIHLDVFSSYKLYGWEQRDEPFQELFDACRNHEKITYHGTQPNEVIREHLKQVHIMAYPSIWMETSCICLMEAMSAGVYPVIPNYGALPETNANWGMLYQWSEDPQDHAERFYHVLYNVISNYDQASRTIKSMSSYANIYYNWDARALQWQNLLTGLVRSNPPRELPKPTFKYTT